MEFGIGFAADAACVNEPFAGFCLVALCYHNDEDGDGFDDSFMRRRFFFFAVKLSWPLSVFESLSESSLESLSDELELDDDELESDAKPVLSCKLTHSAILARCGSFS